MNTSENLKELKLHRTETVYGNLCSFRIRNVLLVCSLYDYYTVDEDGMLADIIQNSYGGWEYDSPPVLEQVSTAEKALKLIRDNPAGYQLVILMTGGSEESFSQFTAEAGAVAPGIKVSVLTRNTEELNKARAGDPGILPYRIFTWMGHGEIIQGILQLAEDTVNAPHDCGEKNVPCLLLVEDDVLFYSRYLYQGSQEIHRSSSRVLKQMNSTSVRKLKSKARIKVLLATNMEEARHALENYGNSIVAVITDMRFHQDGTHDKKAGLNLIQMIRDLNENIPIVLQTSEENGKEQATEMKVGYLDKRSPTLTTDLAGILAVDLDFGNLVFRREDGSATRRVGNVREFGAALEYVPSDQLFQSYISGKMIRWLKIQTELELASLLPKGITPSDSPEKVAELLHQNFKNWMAEQRRGYVTQYSRSFHEDDLTFSRLGNGSMGGKGRGLAFIDRILAANLEENKFRKVSVSVPNTVIITTEYFDEFMDRNDLKRFAIECSDDDRIIRRFQKATLPATILGDLRDYARTVTTPIAVRSSSLLEDAMYQPFAGIYATKMLPNNSKELDVRFKRLTDAVKFVFASTYMQSAKSYIKATNHLVEEEKMAVLLQMVEGSARDTQFYPHFSGVGRSYDFYPAGSAKPEDGVVNVALGLGKAIVDGGVSLRFTPKYPRVLPQFGHISDMLTDSQKKFFAVELDNNQWGSKFSEDQYLTSHDLATAEKQGTLEYLASTYDAVNERVSDGITSYGPRIVNFAHILKNGIFPLPQITDYLLKMGETAMGCPVEIEFAVTLGRKRPLPAKFSLLQIRPMVVNNDLVEVSPDKINRENLFCFTDTALGNGRVQAIENIVYVKPETFTASKTKDIVGQLDKVNRTLFESEEPYILIGPGRWGSSDPWLGIPVTWSQICGAKVIVEASQPNMNIDPSQGSHFFQNMTSLGVVYFTVPHNKSGALINWEWLETQETVSETEFLRHVKLAEPATVMVDGRSGAGAIVTGES